MPTWGPATCGLGPGTVYPFQSSCTLFDSGQQSVFITEQTGSAAETFSGDNRASWGVNTLCYDSKNTLIATTVNISLRFSAGTSGTWSNPCPAGTTRIVVVHVCSLFVGQTCSCTANGTFAQGGNCAFGTQLNPSSNPIIYITNLVIDTVLSPIGGEFLAPVLSVLVGQTIDLTSLCGQGPPPMPTIDTSTLQATAQSALRIFQSAAWYTYCECRPGTPAPTPFPPPALTPPTGWPTPPTFSCSNADICTALATIQAELSAVQMSVGEINQLVTLLQRYKLPFAYVPGATHSNLVGSQSIAISGLLGVEVLVSASPNDPRLLPGTPNYVWDVGWMSASSPDGMLLEKRITRQSQIWLPDGMPLCTSWGYFLNDEWAITMRELEAET